MATEWKSQQGEGKFALQFETDCQEKYRLVEKAAQMAMDGKTEADFVEIPCRCNECKSFVENKEALVTYCTRECKNLTVKPTDFCIYGKRK